MRLLPLALVLVFVLAGCATPPPEAGCTRLAQGVGYCPQPLPAGRTLSVNQLVEYSLPNLPVAERLVFAIEAAGPRMRVVAMTPMGQSVFRLELNDGRLAWDGPPQVGILVDALPALMQLALWPEEAARAGLRGAELQAGPQGRSVRHRGEAIVETRQSEADPTRGEVDIRFNAIGARFRVVNLEDRP